MMNLHAVPASDQQTSSADATRVAWIDFARALGVILVVYGHVLRGVVSAEIFPDGPVAQWTDYTLYTFHMPLFFFLAGLNVQHSLRRGAYAFLENKVWTIVYPYLLWSLFQGGITVLMSRNANIPIHVSDLTAIWYRPIAQFWFLYALMICHLLAVFVPSRPTLIVIAVACLVTFWLLPGLDLRLTLYHLPFYVAGLYGTRVIAAWRPSGLSFLAIMLAFAAVVSLSGDITGLDPNGPASLPAGVLGILAMIALCKRLDGARHHWLAAVGAASMTIYVLHILVGSGLRIAMLKLHVPPEPWLYLLSLTAAGVVVPLLAHHVLARFGLLTAVGLAPPSKRKPIVTEATSASPDWPSAGLPHPK